MKKFSTSRATLASFVAVVAAVSISMGCSSSNGTVDSGTGTGGKIDSGSTGTGGKIADAGVDVQVTHLLLYTFDSGIQMWALSPFPDSPARNLGATYAIDGGGTDAQVFDGGLVTPPTLSYDPVIGEPGAGSLKVTATFTDCNQYVDPIVNLPMALNLTNKTIHARLQVTSGGFSGGAQLHISTGATFNAYTKADFTVGAPATFGNAALNLTTAIADTGTLDPTTVVQVGVQIFSGSACTAAIPYANVGELVTFNIDTVTD
jgi:hypothetical protein